MTRTEAGQAARQFADNYRNRTVPAPDNRPLLELVKVTFVEPFMVRESHGMVPVFHVRNNRRYTLTPSALEELKDAQ